MKAFSIIPVLFLLLFLGVSWNAHAQAGASMSYTIVITENTMDHTDSHGYNYDDRGYDLPVNCKESERVFEAVKNASNELQIENNQASVKNIYAFKNNLNKSGLLTGVSIRDEGGSLSIIMEYN